MSLAAAFAVATTERDARDIAALHELVAERHRDIEGARPWRTPAVALLLAFMKKTVTVVARHDAIVVGTFRLDVTRGFCGIAPFTAVPRFVYLLDMLVHPEHERRGVGRACLAEAERRARQLGASAVRLDTNDDGVGAGAFYSRCGYREVLRHAQTVYFEKLLPVLVRRRRAR